MKTLPPLFPCTDFAFVDIVNTIHGYGTWEKNHTGIEALTVFGLSYRLKVREHEFPILTLKETKWKAAIAELIWYLSGEPTIKEFGKYSKIWNQWADPEGQLESAYGRYWRGYPLPGHYVGREHDTKHLVKGESFPTTSHPAIKFKDGLYVFDQLTHLINSLKRESRSRRLLLSAWYPPNAAVSKLPPCHHTATLVTQEINGVKTLNLHLNQRSMDVGLGFSFNQVAYSTLLLLVAKETGYSPGEFWHTISDAHIYEDHLEPLLECIKRPSHALPSIKLPSTSLLNLSYDDAKAFKLKGYEHEPFIPLKSHE
jgi:thymidylate synthase